MMVQAATEQDEQALTIDLRARSVFDADDVEHRAWRAQIDELVRRARQE
jgi:hypothetical protein